MKNLFLKALPFIASALTLNMGLLFCESGFRTIHGTEYLEPMIELGIFGVFEGSCCIVYSAFLFFRGLAAFNTKILRTT